MCDYSLCGIPNRLAVEGEELVTHRFMTMTIGLASPADLPGAAPKHATPWERVKNFVKEVFAPTDLRRVAAVCIPPGAQLVLDSDVILLGRTIGRAGDPATFVQLHGEPYHHRDAIQFEGGESILLQHLDTCCRFRVLSLAPRGEQVPRRRLPSFIEEEAIY